MLDHAAAENRARDARRTRPGRRWDARAASSHVLAARRDPAPAHYCARGAVARPARGLRPAPPSPPRPLLWVRGGPEAEGKRRDTTFSDSWLSGRSAPVLAGPAKAGRRADRLERVFDYLLLSWHGSVRFPPGWPTGVHRQAVPTSRPPPWPGCSTWCRPTTVCMGCCDGTRSRWRAWPVIMWRRACRAPARDTAAPGPTWAGRCPRTGWTRYWPPTAARAAGWWTPPGPSI